MRLAHLAGKEIINLYDGTRLGVITQPDAVIDGREGNVRLILAVGGIRLFRPGSRCLGIPWEAVKKIGHEVVVVDLAPARGGLKALQGAGG